MSDKSIWDTINTTLANVGNAVGAGREIYDKVTAPSRDILMAPELPEPAPTPDKQPIYGPALPPKGENPAMAIAAVVGLVLLMKVL